MRTLSSTIPNIKGKARKRKNDPTVKTIALDWLEFNLIQTGKLESDVFHSTHLNDIRNSKNVGDFVAVPNADLRTRVFSRCHEIYHKGEKFATIFHAPYSQQIKQYSSISLKIENKQLYSNWHALLVKLCNSFAFTLENIKRMDVAADGFNFMKPVNLVRMGKLETVGSAQINLTLKGKRGVDSFMLGSRNSDRFARCYYKQREIDQASKKYYINKFWKKNGVDPGEFKDMQRLEVTMKCKEINRMAKVNWQFIQSLTKVETLVSLAKTGFKRLYEFREVTDKLTNVSRAKKRFQIIWNAQGKLLNKVKTYTAQRIRSMQTTIKNTYQLYLKTGRSYYNNLADEIMMNTGLEHWFEKRKSAFDYEYFLSLKYDKPFISLYDQGSGQYVRPELSKVKATRRRITI